MKQKPNCIDCGKTLSTLSAIRCKSCETKRRKPWTNFTEETRRKLSFALMGDKSPNWKGNDASIKRIHIWLKSRIPKPELCQVCNKEHPIDLASINHVYKRDDYTSWKWVCRKCHMKIDNRYEPFLKVSNEMGNGQRDKFGRFLSKVEWLQK